MQVSNVNSCDNTNFKSCCAKKTKYDKALNKLKEIDVVKKNVEENKIFNEFCKNHDVVLKFTGRKYPDFAEATLNILYKPVKEPGFINSIRYMFEKYKQFEIAGWGNDFAESVKNLNAYIRYRDVLNIKLSIAEGEAAKAEQSKGVNKKQQTAVKDEAKKQKEELDSLI